MLLGRILISGIQTAPDPQIHRQTNFRVTLKNDLQSTCAPDSSKNSRSLDARNRSTGRLEDVRAKVNKPIGSQNFTPRFALPS